MPNIRTTCISDSNTRALTFNTTQIHACTMLSASRPTNPRLQRLVCGRYQTSGPSHICSFARKFEGQILKHNSLSREIVLEPIFNSVSDKSSKDRGAEAGSPTVDSENKLHPTEYCLHFLRSIYALDLFIAPKSPRSYFII